MLTENLNDQANEREDRDRYQPMAWEWLLSRTFLVVFGEANGSGLAFRA